MAHERRDDEATLQVPALDRLIDFLSSGKASDLRRIERKLDHLHDMLHAILEAVVTDPAKLKQLKERLKGSSEALKTAVDANQPKEK